MSIPELARKMGTERRTINLFLSRLEAGKGGSLKTLSKYAEALEIDPFMFFYEVKENVIEGWELFDGEKVKLF